MSIDLFESPNETAERLTGRPYLSFSAVSAYRRHAEHPRS